jgi:cytoskeleton protein RodZ
MSALGERFRSAREARGLSLSDVSEQIRIRSVYLAAIEDQNWGAIGAPVYVRGFLRTYARFLGLDSEEIVAEFNRGSQDAPEAPAAAGAPASPSVPVSQKGHAGGGGSAMIWTAALVAVALIAFVVYNELSLRRQNGAPVLAAATASPSALPSNSPGAGGPAAVTSASPAAIASPGPSGSPSASASPVAGSGPVDGKQTLALVLSAPSWLRVTVDGNVSMEGTFPAGTSKTFHGKSARVLIGNAGGVEVYVDGKDLGKLGKSGDVVEHAFTL